jgi:hypothetical protein
MATVALAVLGGLASPGLTYPRPGRTERVSVASDGAQGNADTFSTLIGGSQDGRFVSFHSAASNLVPGDTNELTDVFVHDRDAHLTERVSVATDGSQGNGDSQGPSVSDDGRYIAFWGSASNLVAGDTNGDFGVARGRVPLSLADFQRDPTFRYRVLATYDGRPGSPGLYPRHVGHGLTIALQE